MKINVKFTDMRPNTTLRAYAQTKVKAFEKILGTKEAIAAICCIEFKRSKHHTGDICSAEVTLAADGDIFRVEKSEPTFEKAIDKVKDDILRSLRGAKEKNITTKRKGCGTIKKMMQNA